MRRGSPSKISDKTKLVLTEKDNGIHENNGKVTPGRRISTMQQLKPPQSQNLQKGAIMFGISKHHSE